MSDAPDPLGCRDALAEALARPALDALEGTPPDLTPDAVAAALDAAVALGRCRLFGVALPDDLDGVLPPAYALAAAAGLSGELPRRADDTRRLAADGPGELLPFAAEEPYLALLEARLDAWAALVALDEAHAEAAAGDDPLLPDLAGRLDAALDAADAFDDALRGVSGLQSVAGETNLLSNWRRLLAKPYADLLPWWLEEGEADAGAGEGPETQPGPELWRRLRPEAGRLREPLTAAAAVGEAPRYDLYRWLEPGGWWLAHLVVPPVGEQEAVTLRFVARDEAAPPVAGRRVRLAGAEETVAADDTATFALARLRAAGRPLALQVGPDMAEWTPLPQE